MISRTTYETMKVICNRKDECFNKTCRHYRLHDRDEIFEDSCQAVDCFDVEGYVECIQADPIRFELIS